MKTLFHSESHAVSRNDDSIRHWHRYRWPLAIFVVVIVITVALFVWLGLHSHTPAKKSDLPSPSATASPVLVAPLVSAPKPIEEAPTKYDIVRGDILGCVLQAFYGNGSMQAVLAAAERVGLRDRTKPDLIYVGDALSLPHSLTLADGRVLTLRATARPTVHCRRKSSVASKSQAAVTPVPEKQQASPGTLAVQPTPATTEDVEPFVAENSFASTKLIFATYTTPTLPKLEPKKSVKEISPTVLKGSVRYAIRIPGFPSIEPGEYPAYFLDKPKNVVIPGTNQLQTTWEKTRAPLIASREADILVIMTELPRLPKENSPALLKVDIYGQTLTIPAKDLLARGQPTKVPKLHRLPKWQYALLDQNTPGRPGNAKIFLGQLLTFGKAFKSGGPLGVADYAVSSATAHVLETKRRKELEKLAAYRAQKLHPAANNPTPQRQ